MNNQFEEYSQKGMEFLKTVASNLGTPEDLAYADRLTESVFAVLRDIITPQESLHLISNLPMYLKARYVNGWKIKGEPPRVKTREEFFALLREKYPRTTGRPLGDHESVHKDVRAVLAALRTYINEGELQDIQAQMPKPVAELWEMESLEMREA